MRRRRRSFVARPELLKLWLGTASVGLYSLVAVLSAIAGLVLVFAGERLTAGDVASTVSGGPELAGAAISILTAALVLWIPAAVLAVLSPWWTRGQKTVLHLSPVLSVLGIVLAVIATVVADGLAAVVLILWHLILIAALVLLDRAARVRAGVA